MSKIYFTIEYVDLAYFIEDVVDGILQELHEKGVPYENKAAYMKIKLDRIMDLLDSFQLKSEVEMIDTDE